MKNDAEILVELIRSYDKVRMVTDQSSQAGKARLAGLRATIKSLKERMTLEELCAATDLLSE